MLPIPFPTHTSVINYWAGFLLMNRKRKRDNCIMIFIKGCYYIILFFLFLSFLFPSFLFSSIILLTETLRLTEVRKMPKISQLTESSARTFKIAQFNPGTHAFKHCFAIRVVKGH